MTPVEDDVREFFATAPLDVPPTTVPVAEVVRRVRRRRRRRTSAMAGALAGAVAAVAAGAVMVVGLNESPDVVATGSPSAGGITDLDYLPVITPTDFRRLAIGMTLDQVREQEDAEISMLGPRDACAARVAVGDDVRGYLEEWPGPGGDLVVTTVVYYGADARTTTDVAVGRRFEIERFEATVPVDTPLGPGVTVVIPGSAAPEQGPMGVGYQTLAACHEVVQLGVPSQ